MSKFSIRRGKGRVRSPRMTRVRSAASKRWSAFRDRPARVAATRQRPAARQPDRQPGKTPARTQEQPKRTMPALRRRSNPQRELDVIRARAREIEGRATRARTRAGR